MAFVIDHGALSDVGRKRFHNEDRCLVDAERRLFVVCDGMGGGNAGEVASALAVQAVQEHVAAAASNPALSFIGERHHSVSACTNRLASAIRGANERIYRAAWDHAEWLGMGTTIVAVQVHEDVLSFAHVGDSRLYLIRNQTIQPLTVDHSWVAEEVGLGRMTEEEAARSPRRNIVTRALGVEPSVEVCVGELPLFADDRILLCSDGLTHGLQAARLLHSMTDVDDMAAVARRLVALANEAGGEDNTTVVILAVREPSDQGLWQRVRRRWAI